MRLSSHITAGIHRNLNRSDAGFVASYCHHLVSQGVQAIEALSCIREIVTLDKDMLFLQPAQGIPDCPRRERSLANEVLLRELAAILQNFVHKLCRWGQVPDLSWSIISVGGYNKNDPS
jgi:hypothetical protein